MTPSSKKRASSTFVLIHGAGGSSWSWHAVVPILLAEGHRVIAPSLPCDDDGVGLSATVRFVTDLIDAAAPTDSLVVVGHSLGGLVAPVIAAERAADLIVLVAPMIPKPGESGAQWWDATGHHAAFVAAAERDGRTADADDPVTTFLHDLPPEVAAEAARHHREQTVAVMLEPNPLDRWPDIPTVVIAGRDDRFFPLDFVEATAAARLGADPSDLDVVDAGHLPMLGRPRLLADRLLHHAGHVRSG